jgi:seryl-tRNA synthetase
LTVSATRPDDEASAEWARELIRAGYLVPAGLDGLYAHTDRFETIVEGAQRVISRLNTEPDTTILRFPPVMPRVAFERTGYLRSFPDQAGAISTFTGGDREHARLIHLLDERSDWSPLMTQGDAVLCSAVCHPLYPTITSPLPAGGRRWNLYGYVFRHEPDLDPARLQCFRQLEYIYVGEAEGALAHRDLWVERAHMAGELLGLEMTLEVANDPFFGRLGRMLAANQQEEKLKYEISAPTGPGSSSAAVASGNYHRDHFGDAFGLQSASGARAHSACVGFGMERLALALLWRHGLDPLAWPVDVRRELET